MNENFQCDFQPPLSLIQIIYCQRTTNLQSSSEEIQSFFLILREEFERKLEK